MKTFAVLYHPHDSDDPLVAHDWQIGAGQWFAVILIGWVVWQLVKRKT